MNFREIIFTIHKLSNRNCMYDTRSFITIESKYESVLHNIITSNELRLDVKEDLMIKLFAIKCNTSDILYNNLLTIENRLLNGTNYFK